MPDTAGAWSIIGNLAPLVWLGALLACALLISVLTPVFRDVALAVPTQRSSHRTPTPQWGGLAISAATLGAAAAAVLGGSGTGGQLGDGLPLVLLAALLLVALGGVDDVRTLGPGVKLAVQAGAVLLMLLALPGEWRVLPLLPAWLERPLLFVGALWFVNLVNFMDGIDWMMVAEVVPITAGIAVVGALGALPPQALILALALNGAMLGFAPFNRPVARLFMGDMGSLPIGLLLAWLLIMLAGAGHLVAALLLPLYFIADTGITLLRRARAGERLWVAHRTHFYQRARDNGLDNMQIVGRVLAVNMALVGLAALTVVAHSPMSHALALVAGVCLVGWLLLDFARQRR
jgi:UDP-N-acetylmuramyl pentapeptide phosphotransferase/UDP-N-acetylglucosamine-1-phosphate transferase